MNFSNKIDFKIWFVFIAGIIISRTLGCVINDLFDYNTDKINNPEKHLITLKINSHSYIMLIVISILPSIALILGLFFQIVSIKLLLICVSLILLLLK